MCRNGRRGGLKIPCANNTCGFDPHHRHKKESPPARLEGFLFYLRRVRGSNSTALPRRASDQPCGLSLSARETPTTGIKKETPPACLGEFLFYLRRVRGSNSTALPRRASDQPCGLSLSARETPTTGPPACLGEFPFLSAACARVEQHGPAPQTNSFTW